LHKVKFTRLGHVYKVAQIYKVCYNTFGSRFYKNMESPNFHKGKHMKTSEEALANYSKVNDLWRSNDCSIRFERSKESADFNVAKSLIRALWKMEVGSKFPYKTINQVHGNRSTWVKRGVVSINCDKGWGDIVHLWSHWIDIRVNPNLRPHSAEHSLIELRCTKHFFQKGYLEKSRVAIEQPKVKKRINKVAQRYERMLKRQKAWSKKLKLANTNVAKVEKEIRQYERVHSEEKRTTKYLDPLPVREPKEKINWEVKVREWAKENDEFVHDERYWDGYCSTSDRYVCIDDNLPNDYDQCARNKTWQQWWYLIQEGLELKKQGKLDDWKMNY